MGWFSNKSLADEVFELEWQKKNTAWDQRLGQHTWAFVGGLLFFVFVFAMISSSLNQNKNLTWGKVKEDDKLFPTEDFIKDTAYHNFSFCRMIRPITAADIDTMQIPVTEKRKFFTQIDSTLKHPIMLERSEIALSRDSMFKFGIASIGIFVAKDSTTATSEDGVGYDWYEVIPNKQLVDNGYNINIPAGYILANNNYYVRPYDVRLDEPAVFKRYKQTTPKVAVMPGIKTDSISNQKTSLSKSKKKHKRKKIIRRD